MTENSDSSSFWTDARPADRGWMARGRANAARYYAPQEPAEPEPVVPGDDSIGALDLAAYAQVRDQLGIRSASDFAGLDRRVNESGFLDAVDLMGSATALAEAVNPYRVHDTTGYEVRQRGIPASQVQSLGGITGRGNVNPNHH